MPATSVNYEPVRDIFQAMRSVTLDGAPLSEVIGGGDPEQIASETLVLLSRYIEVKAKHSILDVGCGCGRIATALTQYVSSTSRYVGVDIVPALVEFGRNVISPRYPNFKFILWDESNKTYDRLRSTRHPYDIAKLSDACPPGSVDLALSISLFTHLDYEPAREILTAIHRLLTRGGHAFITLFVLDADAWAGIEGNRTGFRFRHKTPSGKLYADKWQDPTHSVGYGPEQLDELVDSAGLRIYQWIRGYWWQGHSGETFQDALILRKV